MNNKTFLISILIMTMLISVIMPSRVHAKGFWNNFDITVDGKNITENIANEGGWGLLIENLKEFIVGVAGVGTVIAVGFFIVNFMKLGGSNSRTRSEAISGLIYSGIATAGLGSVTLITAMFYGMIGDGAK